MSPTSESPTPARRRFWPRFTLRALLVMVMVLCLSLGWWTHRWREQRQIVERIERMGMVRYDYEPKNWTPGTFKGWLLDTLGHDAFFQVGQANVFDRELIRDLPRLPGLNHVEIRVNNLGDADLVSLAQCDKLEWLEIGSSWYLFEEEFQPSRITDDGVRILAEIPTLRYLEIRNATISDAGVQALTESPSLRELEIGTCDRSVSPEDFQAIQSEGRVRLLRAWRVSHDKHGVEEIVNWRR
jgi:hypothetical protein